MKKEFSTKWIASKQKRKQVKYRENAPLHIKHKLMSSNLNKELRKKYSRRSFPIRKGDKVKIMRGKFSGKEGKINKVDLKRLRVSIEGIQTQKKDGTKVNVYFNPSKLQIQELNLEDKKRLGAIQKKNNIKPGEKNGKNKGEENAPKKK